MCPLYIACFEVGSDISILRIFMNYEFQSNYMIVLSLFIQNCIHVNEVTCTMMETNDTHLWYINSSA